MLVLLVLLSAAAVQCKSGKFTTSRDNNTSYTHHIICSCSVQTAECMHACASFVPDFCTGREGAMRL